MPVRTLVLYGPDGTELARYELADLPQLQVQPEAPPVEVPKTLDWYRDATKWLVAASAATLVLGLGFFGETSVSALRALFTFAGLLFLASLAAGALAHLWILEFGKLWENRGLLGPENVEDIRANEREQVRYQRKIRIAYCALLWTFFIGMAAFALTCGVRMWLAKSKGQQDARIIFSPREILFENNQSVIDPGSLRDIVALARSLKPVSRFIYIEGHTDSVGSSEYNLHLSKARAEAVRAAFVQEGVQSERIQVLPHGKTSPIGRNDTVEGRSRNRRVLIRVEER